MMRIFHSPAYGATAVAFDTTRKADAIAASLVADPLPGIEVVPSRAATIDELLTTHSRRYMRAVLEGKPDDLAGSNGLGWDQGLAQAVLASTGGVRDAALWAMEHRTIAGSLSSGLHHARHSTGAGFCTVNGLVVAAHAALAAGATRVLILDLDAHCGGGTSSLIEGVEGVEQVDVSVNRFDHYTNTANARLLMADGTDYLDVIRSALTSIERPEQIDLVLYNAGMDPCDGAGGIPGIDASTLMHRERIVFRWSLDHRLPVAWVLAGGYTHDIDMDQLVELHRLTIDAAIAGEAGGEPHSTSLDEVGPKDDSMNLDDQPTPADQNISRYTVPSDPPKVRQKERFSRWEESFEECRRDSGNWRKVDAPIKKSTASQLASDIRNAHRREFAKSRLKGLRPDERWDAQWGEVDGQYFVWLCHLGSPPAEA